MNVTAMNVTATTSMTTIGPLLALSLSVFLNVWLYRARKEDAAKLSAIQSESPSFLPEGWWSSPSRFQDERRAIFSQTWMCVSHRGRFKTPGDYIVYEIAGFRFFMILGKDSVVRSFHNVCRHRAFPVARKQSGTATVLGCRYHGWSYDTTGRLTKAPFFDDVPGFDKSQNSLYEIHTKEDSHGFLHINPSTGEGVEKSSPPTGTMAGKLARIRPPAQLLHTLELGGKFNWKLLLDKTPRSSSAAVPQKGIIGAFSTRRGTSVGELSYFPLTTVHSTSNRPFWYQLTYNPMSAEQTAVRCDVYSVKSTGNVELGDEIMEALKRELKLKVQALEGEQLRAVAASTMLPSRAQSRVSADVEAHLRQERRLGTEIKPAAVRQQFHSELSAKADQICKAIECGTKEMDW